jgi:hypothetical protein
LAPSESGPIRSSDRSDLSALVASDPLRDLSVPSV